MGSLFYLPYLKVNAKKKTVPNKGRKTTAKKARVRNQSKNSKGKSKRAKDVRKKVKLPSPKPVRKISSKRQVQANQKPRSTSRKGVGKESKSNGSKTKGILTVAKQTRKTGKQLDYTFKGVRNVDRKIDLFVSQSDKSLKKQLAKKGGKPPRGIVVVVTDKNGQEAAAVSPLDFVVNQKNVKKFTAKFLKELRDNNEDYRHKRQKIIAKKRKATGALRELLEEAEENYGNYNPDNISEISIKFIY